MDGKHFFSNTILEDYCVCFKQIDVFGTVLLVCESNFLEENPVKSLVATD